MAEGYDAGSSGRDRTALLATHIDPGWSGPDGFGEVVERYVASEEYDSFIYISNPGFCVGGYEEIADQVYHSDFGSLDPSDVEGLLDAYNEFVHIGAYWGQCHAESFTSLVDGISSRSEGVYTVSMPLDGVTTIDRCVADIIEDVGGLDALYQELDRTLDALVSAEGVEGEWMDVVPWLRSYTLPVDDVFGGEGLRVGLSGDPVPTIEWRFTPRRGAGSWFDYTDDLLDEMGIDKEDYYGWS